MRNVNIKFSTVNNEIEKVLEVGNTQTPHKRIDEERLFTFFTANIIKLKKRFTR
jgi:hypothetical protein